METKSKIFFSFHGLVNWSAFTQMIYKLQEMLHVRTRHKMFHFLTEEQQGDRDKSRHLVATFLKDAHPKNGSGNLAASPLTILFGCF